jgi:hypothetical protein
LESRHPLNQADDGNGDLSFAEQLVIGLPQFLLSVWELQLHGWSRLSPEDPVSRILLEVRDRRPICGHRSAVDVAFVTAGTMARVLEEHTVMRDGLAALRQRHARQQAAQPWCWLRFFWERQQAFDILCLLGEELRRWQGSTIITPGRMRCERWYEAAGQRLKELTAVPQRCSPGFDWSVTFATAVDVPELTQRILRSLVDYDYGLIVEELANELEYFGQWVNRVEAEQKPHAFAEQESEGHTGEDRDPEKKPRVVLHSWEVGPIVLGTTKRKLTTPQYNVVKALLGAGETGLTKDELIKKSGHEDARGILKRLANSDPGWKEVIHFAGQTGGRYRIK